LETGNSDALNQLFLRLRPVLLLPLLLTLFLRMHLRSTILRRCGMLPLLPVADLFSSSEPGRRFSAALAGRAA
jgi:hypothetical protein